MIEQVILRILGDSSSGEKALDRMNQRLRRFGTMLTGASAAALVTFTKLGESGAKVEALEAKFARMARAFGKTADEMLATWEEAAAGTISRSEMMRKANQAALLGLPVDRLADLLKIARNAAESTGESVSYMFDSLVSGIGRQSKLVLDNLGIVFTATEAYEAYGKKIGKSAKALNAQEKQTAFLEATLRAASRQQEILGEVTDNASTKIARAKASLANAKDEISKAFVPVAVRLYEIVGAIAKAFSAIPEPIKRAGASLAASAAGFGAILGPLMTLKGSLPLIKMALAAIGGSLGAIAPIVAVVLALIAVIKLAARAWKENWGGIQETVQAVIDVVKPVLDGIVADVRYWIGAIKAELAGIMAAIRAIIEPALARLRQLFGDGGGVREFMVTVRDAANVILSTIKNLLEALRHLLEGNADKAWDPLADAALNVITIIVIGWRKYISKALTYGWNLVVQLANGIIKAGRTVLRAAATFIGNMLGRFFAPGSPPREGPLRGIVKWGKGLIDTFFKAFGLADFGILRDVLSPVRQALESAVALGDIDRPEALGLFRELRGEVAALIADFRKTGEISEEALGSIAEKLGEGGEEYAEYLRLTLEHQKALDRLKNAQDAVAEARKKGWVPKALEDQLTAAEEEAQAAEDKVNWQREYLSALQEGVDLQVEMVEALKELTETLKGVGETEVGEGAIAPVGLGEGLTEAFEGFTGFGGFSEGFNKVKEEVKTWFENLPGNISTWLENAKTTIATKWTEIKTKVRTTLLQIAAIVLGWLLLQRQNIIEKYEEIKTDISTKWNEIKTRLWMTLLQIAAIILGWLLLQRQAIIDKWEEIKTDISTKWDEIKTSVSEKAEELRADLAAKWEEVKTGVSEAWGEIKTTISDKITEAKDAVVEKVNDFIQAGKDLIGGLLSGLTEKWAEVSKWFSDTVANLPQWAKDVLGIASPSRVFAGIGQDMAAGLAQGFNSFNLLSAIQSGIEAITSPLSMQVAGLGGVGGGAGAGVGALAGAGGGSTVIYFGEGSFAGAFPNVQDGRDADSIMKVIQEKVQEGYLRAQVPGGLR